MNRKKICIIIVCFAVGIALILAIACLAIASAFAEDELGLSFIAKDSLVVISTNNLREDGGNKNLLLYAKAGGYYTAAVADWFKDLPGDSFQTENPLVTAVDGFWQESGVIDAIEDAGWGNRLRDFLGTND